MARYPGAIWKPITADKDRQRLTVYNRVNFHIAVSEAPSLHPYFNQRGIPDSHFYVRRDGTVEQYVDTNMRAYADLDGNDATISIETQGMGTGGWTAAQRESLAQLYAWAVRTHGIARKLATSSRVGSSESTGLSWHRLGCDGNFPSSGLLAGRLQRGADGVNDPAYMHYSTSFGKVCPGDDQIEQIPSIYNRALVILDGAPIPGGFMPELTDEQQQALYNNVNQIEVVVRRHEEDDNTRRTADLAHMSASASRDNTIIATLTRVEAKLDQLLARPE